MAITVAELQLKFDAETKRTKSDIDRLDKRIKKFGTSSKRSTDKATRGFNKLKAATAGIGAKIGVIGAAAGVAGGLLIAAVKNAAAFGDNIAKTADRLGITTTRLQEFDFAATQSGASSAGLQTAIGKLAKGLGELQATGLGTLDTLLKDSNVELLNMLKNTSSVEEGLFILADAISESNDELEQAALASGAFGRQGLILINLLKKGRAGFKAYADQAHELGIILDEDVLRNSEKITDQFDIVTRRLGTTFKQALIDIGPFVTDLASDFGDLTEGLAFMLSKMRDIEDVSLRQAQQQADELANELSDLLSRREELESGSGKLATIREFLGIPPGGFGGLEQLEAEIDSVTDKLLAARAVIADKTAPPPGGGPPGGGAPDAIDPSAAASALKTLQAQQEAGLASILASTREIILARIEAIEPLEAEIAALGLQIEDVEKLKTADGEATEAKLNNLALLAEERAKLQKMLGDQRQEEVDLSLELEDALAKVKAADIDRVEAILAAAAARENEGKSVAEINDAIREALADVNAILGEDGGEGDGKEDPALALFDSFAGATQRGILSGLDAAINGEGVDLLQTFGDIFQSVMQDSLNAALDSVTDTLRTMLEEFTSGLSDAADGSGGGGFNFGALIGGVASIGGGLLAGALRDTEVNAKRANITSAVNSSQQIRGVVAGPQGIAIAKVSEGIADANVKLEQRLDILIGHAAQTAVNTAMMAAASGGVGGGFDPTASETLG